MPRPPVGGLLALLAALPATPLHAQAPGDRVQVSYTLPFSSHNQSMWGPADAPANLNFTVPLFDESWSENGTANGIFSQFGFSWGGSIGGSTAGRVGLSFRIFDIGTGDVDLDYPVRAVLDLPAPNSFRAGDVVTVGSHYELLPGWKLGTSPPGGALSLDGVFRTSLGASLQACFFDCAGFAPGVNIPLRNFQIFAITSQGTLTLPAVLPPPFPQPIVINTLPYQFGGLLDPIGPFLGFEGPVDGPRVTTSATVGADGRTLTAAGQHRFVDLTADLDQYLTFVGVPPLGFQTPAGLTLVSGASFGYDVANLALLFGVTQRQTFRFMPWLTLDAQFPIAVDFAVLNADGSTAATGNGMAVTFDVGQSLRITMPAGPRDPLPGTPTYGLANTFTSSTDFAFNERLVVSAGRFELVMPDANVTTQVTETVCRGFPGVLGEACELLGGVLETITTTVTNTVSIPDVHLGPLFSQELVNQTQTLPLFPTSGRSGQWQFAGLPTFTEAPFVLDPEDPRIAVATDLGSGVMSGGPAGSILQTVRVRNEGDVPLSAAALRDAVAALLSGGTFTVISVSSPTLVTNPGFNGAGQPDLLGAGNSLPVGAEGEVQVVFGVNAGSIYRTDVHAAGRSPIGTDVSADASDRLGFVVFEIIPDQVSAWSNGVLPTRVFSTGIDAGQIDAAGLRLEGIAPEQWNLTSSGELIAKFRLPDVLAASDHRILASVPIPAASAGEPATLDQLVASVMRGSGDLGELRAFVMAQRSARGVKGDGPTPFASAANGASRVLVLSGSLRDGTRLIGEDDLTVMQGGQ